MIRPTVETYAITDAQTGILLSDNIPRDRVDSVVSTYESFGYALQLAETAAGGSTGAGSVAVNMSDGPKKVPMETLIAFMKRFNSRVKNRSKLKTQKPFAISIDEAFDIDQVFSRLGSMERRGRCKRSGGNTFGIEDDHGNVMKVTVSADQARAFEEEVGRHLATIKKSTEGRPAARGGKEVSMAELLYLIKDKFNILDVEFPLIPKDVIYNVDRASDINVDRTGADVTIPHGELDLRDYKEPDNIPAAVPHDEAVPADVEEFTGSHGDESILNKVIDMLKAQAESDIERAKADAEKARAEQARYTAQATRYAIKDQEERLRYELELEEQKKREREAKKIEDMARHRISKTLATYSGIAEAEEGASPEMVARQRQQINARYAILPTDSQEERIYKTKRRAEAMREWTAKYQQALNQKKFERARATSASTAASLPANKPTGTQQSSTSPSIQQAPRAHQ